MISKPISEFSREQNNRGIGPGGPDGRFIRSPSKQKRAMVLESDSESETPLMDTESPKPQNSRQTQPSRAHSGEADQSWSETNQAQIPHRQQPHQAH